MLRSGTLLWIGVVCFVGLTGSGSGLSAGEPAAGAASKSPPKVEVWSGAQAFSDAWSLYAGATLAPSGSIERDGWRLRSVAGYSFYTYIDQGQKIRAEKPFADLLAGYQLQLGTLTLKAFGGVAIAQELGAAGEPDTFGAKALLEAWWTVSDKAWSSLDVGWTSLDDGYAARLRVGWRMLPALSIGLEGGATGGITCRDCHDLRAGAFVRHEWGRGEISLSGGLASDGGTSGPHALRGAFATVNWLSRF